MNVYEKKELLMPPATWKIRKKRVVTKHLSGGESLFKTVFLGIELLIFSIIITDKKYFGQ